MIDIQRRLSQELGLRPVQVENALALLSDGATVPFIARYRKERTGEMNETQLRILSDRFAYLSELEERKMTILRSIEEKGALTDELKAKIEACLLKSELEDIYLPYRPRRRTRATAAREKGLEPLAGLIRSLNSSEAAAADLEAEAARYVSEELGVATPQEALQGASDILAEEVSEKAGLRACLRRYLFEEGSFRSRIKEDFPPGTTKFEIYRDYEVRVRDAAPHQILALLRGETERILVLTVAFDQNVVDSLLQGEEIHTEARNVREFYVAMLSDAFERLIKPSLTTEVRQHRKAFADAESVKTFESNLRDLLLASPAGMKPTLGIDPGFRTGCKVAAIDATGRFLEHQTVYPHRSEAERAAAAEILKKLIAVHRIELIAIGNGTAGRETDAFVGEVLATVDKKPLKVMVSEAGASVYSASEAGVSEFPDLDVTVRGAISIGRRLQDPLAELVKIDPKSIGVGQYQHDVDQALLKKKLHETVESCVNYVGVDLNLASAELMSYVSGISRSVARNIIAHRNAEGPFRNRRRLLEVRKFGAKAFEQAAGFLRIRGGDNPLDNTGVHPESYFIVERIARDLDVPLAGISKHAERLRSIDLARYKTESIGEPTLRDIVAELEKPGRDPRTEFRYATFQEGIREITDLEPGRVLEGVVTNVTNFGAFVDIGVHQDGLVHISQLSDSYVDDPRKIVRVGQIVKVRVLEVNAVLKRISLSMKSRPPEESARRSRKPAKGEVRAPTIDDLRKKFDRRRP